MTSFKFIDMPISIRNVEIKNRVVRSAHGTNIGRGELNDDLIAYHLQRAKGGVGLTFVEYCSVHPSNYSPQLQSWDDSIIPRYRALMAAVKPHGMTVFQQLSHGGLIYPGVDGIAWSASAVTSPISGASQERSIYSNLVALGVCLSNPLIRYFHFRKWVGIQSPQLLSGVFGINLCA